MSIRDWLPRGPINFHTHKVVISDGVLEKEVGRYKTKEDADEVASLLNFEAGLTLSPYRFTVQEC